MEATLDEELHNICIKENLNFGRYKNIVNQVSIEFSVNGVEGHQQYAHANGYESVYANDLSELTDYINQKIEWWKKAISSIIYKKADKHLIKMRVNYKI